MERPTLANEPRFIYIADEKDKDDSNARKMLDELFIEVWIQENMFLVISNDMTGLQMNVLGQEIL